MRRGPVLVLSLAVVGALLVAGFGTVRLVWRHHRQQEGQAMSIDGTPHDASASWPTPASTGTTRPVGPPFVSSVSPDGRYFLDQYGHPLLVHGDSPWAFMTKLSPEQAEVWLADREKKGFNAAITSLIGATSNGGVSDDGRTFDGLRPFVDGDVLTWRAPYWRRMSDYLGMAAEHGITVMLYPIDGWAIGHSFVPKSIEQCHLYGRKVAERFRDRPNLVWMAGGDYFPATEDLAQGSDVDHCVDAMMRGIRETGDSRPFSIQLGPESTSTDNPYWARRVNWNFVYSYNPTYASVLDAYDREPSIPAVLGEANYEGENNVADTPPTTDETLRRQVLWALTSGAAGEFVGSDDWEFHDGWEQRLSTTALTQITRIRRLFSTFHWWQLVPDTDSRLVTGGRGSRVTTLACSPWQQREGVGGCSAPWLGEHELPRADTPRDVLENDYVTAAKTPDGRLAVIYVPTRRTISVNLAVLPADVRASWVDPTSGETQPVPVSSTLTTPGTNAGGDTDWLLLLRS